MKSKEFGRPGGGGGRRGITNSLVTCIVFLVLKNNCLERTLNENMKVPCSATKSKQKKYTAKLKVNQSKF